MSVSASTIIYTQTDEAPALATHSLLPVSYTHLTLPTICSV